MVCFKGYNSLFSRFLFYKSGIEVTKAWGQTAGSPTVPEVLGVDPMVI